MKIVVISQYYYPEMMRITDICESLVRLGHEITVVTGIPNYPDGDFYKGYSWLKKRQETVNGVSVLRLPIIPRKKNLIVLSLNYLSFIISGWLFVHFRKIKVDVVLNYGTSPITQCLVGIWLGKKMEVPVISYILDLWPESFQEVTGNSSKLIEKFLGSLVDSIYRRSDRILTSSESFIQSIEARGIQKDKISFWPQYAEDFYFASEACPSDKLPRDKRILLTFAGNIGVAQGLDILIPVAQQLQKLDASVCFVLIGDGRDKSRLQSLVESERLHDFFLFIDKQPAQKIPSYLANSDAGLLILKKSNIFSMTIPAKLQTYMACGVPIIGSVDGESQLIIRQAEAGLAADAEDVGQLVSVIMNFCALPKCQREAMGVSARNYALKNYNKKKLLDEFDTILNFS